MSVLILKAFEKYSQEMYDLILEPKICSELPDQPGCYELYLYCSQTQLSGMILCPVES